MSLVFHAVVIAATVYASLNAAQRDNAVNSNTTMVFVDQQQQKPPEQAAQLNEPLTAFETIAVPDVIPTNIPPVSLQEPFDPNDYFRTRRDRGGAAGVPTGNEVFMEDIVEDKPSVLSGPTPEYPELLKQAGIQGRVLVQAVIDTLGRAEVTTVRILQSPNPGFDQAAKNYVLRALLRPARVHGRAVRVLINIAIDFRITQVH